MSFAFKKFSFFQQSEVHGHAFPLNSTCYTSGPGCFLVGCDNGSLHVLDEAFQLLTTLPAHGFRVFELVHLPERNLLVTLGSEEPGYSTASIKVWDVQRLLALAHAPPPPATATAVTSTSGQAPGGGVSPQLVLLKSTKVFSPKLPEGEVTALAAKDLSLSAGAGSDSGATAAATVSAASGAAGGTGSGQVAVAVGLATGAVYVFTLDVAVARAPQGAAPSASSKAAAAAAAASAAASGAAAKGAAPAVKLSARPEAGDACAVMGLALQGGDVGPDSLSLFVVTETQTLSFHVQSGTKSVLDRAGTHSPRCSVVRPNAAGGVLLVARDEGLYEYTLDTRAGCTVFEGGKEALALLRRFVVVVTREGGDVGVPTSTIHITDLRHKLVAGSLSVSNLQAIIPYGSSSATGSGAGSRHGSSAAAVGAAGRGAGAGNSSARQQAAVPLFQQHLAVLTSSGKLFVMKEVELGTQLEALFRRSQHRLALDVARASGAGPAVLAGIQQKWGDALYAKGDYDAAMVQYSETVGHLEPSYVIRRFLDAQRIHNLTSYLELLHDKGLASADHTTLLLNCYTRLKDVAKLDAFCARSGAVGVSEDHFGPSATTPTSTALPSSSLPSRPSSNKLAGSGGSGNLGAWEGQVQGTGPPLKFDAETAVKVLRSAGYPRHALAIARAAGAADWVLDCLVEDCGAAQEALEFLDTLPREARATALRRVGKTLVAAMPEAATRVIAELCIPPAGAVTSSRGRGEGPTGEGDTYVASIADFAHLYAGAPTSLMLLAEFILNSQQHAHAIANEGVLYHTLLELYLADTLPDSGTGGAGSTEGTGAGQDGATGAGATAPSSSAAAGPAQSAEARAQQEEAERALRRHKALDLLQAGWPPHLEKPKYDPDHALVLCRLARFAPGLVLLYDRLRAHREALQVYMDTLDYRGLISAVQRYGDASRGGDPQLWAEVLQYFVDQPQDAPGGGCEAEVVEVVGYIEAGALLPPLVVLQLLARNKHLKVAAVRGYMARALQREAAGVAADRREAARLAGETAALRAECGRLRSQARVFQASRCAASGAPLELPALHFGCGHSFNARALGEGDRECPLCGPEFRKVLEIRKNLAISGLQQDRFFTELREAGDGFEVVATHFGRGVMNLTAAAIANAAASSGPNGGQASGLAGAAGGLPAAAAAVAGL